LAVGGSYRGECIVLMIETSSSSLPRKTNVPMVKGESQSSKRPMAAWWSNFILGRRPRRPAIRIGKM
jgi:hypothetical protein